MADYTPERWAALTEILGETLALSAEARGAYLDEVCAGSPELRAEVERLLASHGEAEAAGRFETGATDLIEAAFPEPEPAGDVGPYKLLREVGRGGMGRVWLAERTDGVYEQRVAIKVMHAGLLTEADRRRFEAERRILARLDHPNVARIIDGGLTADGQSYLVMEYVPGEPITRYCERHDVSLRERVALMRTVCEAVAYAHGKLVVHRDLKPSNIFVSGDGVVKLLDFGIAKLLSDEEHDEMPLTVAGAMRLTPEYASPEQVTGDPITTATDVYALGVVLYELLAGSRPYAIESRAPTAIEEVVCRTVPPRPSHAALARSGAEGPAPDRRARWLRGDLDTIILKALRKEPERRYAAAADLAEDLGRYAAGMPVAARPDTATYRAGKFARRHRVAVIAAAAVLLALIAGLGTALSQARVAAQERDRAERRFEIARETARTLLYDVDDVLASVPGTVEAREALVRRSLDYLDRLSHEADADRSLRLDIAHAYLRAGNVLGNPAQGANLGHMEEAVASYRRGLALLPPQNSASRLPSEDDLDVMWVRALLFEKIAMVEAYRGRPDSAIAYLHRALPLYQAYANDGRGPHSGSRAVAITHLHLGDYTGHPDLPNTGDIAGAAAHYDTMLALLGQLQSSGDQEAARLTGIAHERRGTLLRHAGDADAALAAYQHSYEIRHRLAGVDGASPAVIRDSGIAWEKIGLLHHDRGEPELAIAALASALSVYEQLLSADPADIQARLTVAIGHLHLAEVHVRPGGRRAPNPASAAAHFSHAQDLLTPRPGDDTSNVRMRELRRRAAARLSELQ